MKKYVVFKWNEYDMTYSPQMENTFFVKMYRDLKTNEVDQWQQLIHEKSCTDSGMNS